MRGSPFSFSDFGRGLNVIDSPYTLQQGEARDLLNIVSSPRGAIKKRYGSTVFASGTAASFPTLSVTDSMKRANEKPLNNVGKWENVEASIGAPKGAARIVSEVAVPEQTVTSNVDGEVWNTNKVNPAVSVYVAQQASETGSSVALLACYKAAEGSSFYRATWYKQSGVNKITIEKVIKGVETELATVENVTTAKEHEIGLTVAAGVVRVWNRVPTGTWKVEGEVADAALTEGFGGFAVTFAKVGGVSGQTGVQNFSVGEMGSAPATTEFSSLATVKIGTTNYLIAVSKKAIYSIAEDGTITDITDGAAVTESAHWSIIQSTSGAPNRVAADGPIYLNNGFDPPRYWAGTEKATKVAEWTSKPEGEFVAVPKGGYMVYLGNRVWVAGMSSDQSAVRFTGFSEKEGVEYPDPTCWPKKQVIWFEPENGEPITGMGIAGSYLMVFKAHRTWAVYDLNEGENRRLSDSIGCISHRSIVETPQGTFFLTPDQGVFMTNGTTLREMSRQVRPILQGIDPNTARAAKQDQLVNTSAGFLNGHYYLSYEAQDGTWKTLDYDTVLQSWWLHDLAGLQWVRWEPKAGSSYLYTIPSAKNSGVVKAFVPGVYTDSGANYVGAKGLTCFWASPWEPFWQYFQRHRFNQPNPKKRIRELFVDGKGELITQVLTKFGTTAETLKGSVDNADMASPTSPVSLGSETNEYQAVRYWSLGISRVWSFLFGNNSGQPLEVDSFSVHLNFRKS